VEDNGSDRAFKILVVDNGKFEHDKAHAELSALGDDVIVRSALSSDQAIELIQAEFFDAAFVDWFLGPTRGSGVVRTLSSTAPSCAVFIMSKRLDEDAEHTVELLQHITSEFCPKGVINKTKGDTDWFAPYVAPLLTRWRSRTITVEGLASAVNALVEKRGRINSALQSGDQGLLRLREDPAEVGREVQHLFDSIFGRMGPAGRESVAEVSVFRRGFSSSVVLDVQPQLFIRSLERQVEGNRCVVKIGPKTEIQTEAEHYEQVVRFGLALTYRVELFSMVTADALAAVCYSFAGGNASTIRSFDDLLLEPDGGQWRDVLREIFAPATGIWYATPAPAPALRQYFTGPRGSGLDRSLHYLDKWLDSLDSTVDIRPVRPARGGRGHSRRLKVAGLELRLPTDAMLAEAGLVRAVPGCLAHGDLHGGNIVVDQDGRPYFIDFQNAGVAPRLIDFAALQASVRFSDATKIKATAPDLFGRKASNEGMAQVLSSFASEERYARGLRSGRSAARFDAAWAPFVLELDAALVDNFGDADAEEILWTYWGYALNLFRFQHMEWYRKARILCWLSALTSALEE
jgi:CheY-like chemotaxis protein